MKPTSIEESDWVIFRLLVAIADNHVHVVTRTYDYARSANYLLQKYGLERVRAAVDIIRKEKLPCKSQSAS